MKILIVDDHILFREGIASLFAGQPDLTVIGQANCVQEAVAMANELQPDLILMDFTMPDGTGLDATKAILKQQPAAKILFLTVHENDEMLFEAIRLGAVGYLLKNVSVMEMLKQIRSIDRGEAALMPGMTRKILNEFARRSDTRPHGPAELQTLSLREREFVLAAKAYGAPGWRIIAKHIVPNLLGIVAVYVTLTVPKVILVESFLSFLGLGVQEPNTSWGALVNAGVQEMEFAPWGLFFPAAFLAATLFCLNFLGDGLRDALDPKDR